MKYFATLLLLTLACSASLFAQTPAPSPIPVFTRYAETAESWQTFAPAAEEFSLEAPGAVSLNAPSMPPEPSVEGSVPSAFPLNPVLPKNRQYVTLVNDDYYYIFSEPVGDPHFNKAIYSFAESQAPGIDPNQIYAFADEFGFYHKILIVKSGDRVYTFQTVSATKDSASAKRFFDSIKIKGMKLQASEIEALQNVSAKNSQLAISCNPSLPPPVSNSKTAENKTSELGIGNSESQIALPAPAQTTAVKVISKPRPGYTDFARFYMATGTVALRVTFLANGKVGTISTAKRLPFGLTEQSISAACRIQFEPATKNGVPYTVTRQVQYNFTLY